MIADIEVAFFPESFHEKQRRDMHKKGTRRAGSQLEGGSPVQIYNGVSSSTRHPSRSSRHDYPSQ